SIFSETFIAGMSATLMILFVVMLLLFGPIYLNGHKAYDHMDDLYSQTEGERIRILSGDGPG
ncbi:MAG: hypothetical protein ACC656_06305, partial [Candidatus Heimdallarchaeota archaeon]